MAGSGMLHFRRFFVRGLATVLPTLLTLGIIIWVVGLIHKWFGRYINLGLIILLDRVVPGVTETQIRNFWDRYWGLHAIGSILAIIAIYFVGRFVASFIGRSIWRMIEQGLLRTPIIRQIYPSVKQVTDFLFTERKELKFSRVVAAEYPRKGIWSVGFVTGPGMRALREHTATEMLTVFIPSSPTPVTGYVITVRRDEVIDLPLTIDEALRMVVSCGVLLPSSQMPPGAELPAPKVEESRLQSQAGLVPTAGKE